MKVVFAGKKTMIKAGKMVLLGSFLLLILGAAPQLNAQEKLLSQKLGENPKSYCTPLDSLFVSAKRDCELKKLTQKDLSQKAEGTDEVKPNTVSYTIEPTKYDGPVVPSYSIPEPETLEPKMEPVEATPTISQPVIQEPRDMLPQSGPNLDSNLILSLINTHRANIGKPAFQTEPALCSLAVTRSTELPGEFANGTLHSGLYNRNLPYFITEDTKWGSNEAGTVKWWLNSSVHRRAIEGDYTYSCGACQGSACAQLFTSYTPKQYLVSKPTITPTPPTSD